MKARNNKKDVETVSGYISKNTILKVLADSEPKEEDWRIDNAENYDLRKIRFLAASNVYEEIKDVLSCDRLLADVAPIVHGHWIINSDGYYPQCSNCMREPESGKMTEFCPHCGAEMSESEEKIDV